MERQNLIDQDDEESQSLVVVIDDDETTRHIVGAVIAHGTRSKVEAFADGRSALNFLMTRQDASGELPPVDAILCDIRMPGMSGHEFLLEIRSAGLDVPVVFLTGFIEESTLFHAMRLGAFDVVSKPIEKHSIVPTMELAINVGSRRRNMWRHLAAVSERLAQGELTPEAQFDLQRHVGEIQKEFRMTGLLALRNHSLKSGS